jgi:ubiquinol-cytochrome c reductase cytochrome b subunit
VSQPTLNRLFSIHFVIPLIIIVIVTLHLLTLHEKGSSNPLGSNENTDKIEFHQKFSTKDLSIIITTSLTTIIIILNYPIITIDNENITYANPSIAPEHIQPEWYFLFAYAILRSIPSKLGGVIAMTISVLILITIMKEKINKYRKKFNPQKKTKISTLIRVFVTLT